MYGYDVVGAALRGEVSVRALRVMLDGLSPDSAWYRALGRVWTDDKQLLWNLDAQLRGSNAALQTIAAILRAAHKITGGEIPIPKFLPNPDNRDEEIDAQDAAHQRDSEADLLRVLNR